MGYFNYFIKCIIRNIAYRLCKPKVLLTVLLSVIVLFGLKHYGFCALSDGDYEMIANGFAVITNNQGVVISQLSSMGVDVRDVENNLNSIKSQLSSIQENQVDAQVLLNRLITDVENLNTTLIEMAEQQNIYYKDVTEDLQVIRESLLGTESKNVAFQQMGLVNNINAGSVHSSLLKVYIPMEYKYTYTVKVTYKNPSTSNIQLQYMFDSKNLVDGNSTSSRFSSLGSIGAGTITKEFVITTRDYKKPYLYLFYGFYVTDVTVEASIEGLVDVIDRTNQEINTGIQEGNQLQQEQNQLQQEQNNFLKDDNVNTESFEFATDDTVNPTSDGFNTLFTSIYNAFCNTSSAPLTITLPYVNETFTIKPNLVSNAMQKMRIGSCSNFDSIILLLWCLSFYI